MTHAETAARLAQETISPAWRLSSDDRTRLLNAMVKAQQSGLLASAVVLFAVAQQLARNQRRSEAAMISPQKLTVLLIFAVLMLARVWASKEGENQ